MSAVTQLRWSHAKPPDGSGVLLPDIFVRWHRAKNLGIELASVTFDGHPLPVSSLEKLNMWLFADGAWRASLLDHFEAEKVLAAVIRRDVVIPLGSGGGGRWPSGSSAKILLRYPGQSVQCSLGL